MRIEVKENKSLHVTIAAAWILVRATIRFRDVLRLDRRGADRRCPSDVQGGGSARTASSHRKVPLARREPRRFLLHFRHLFHREPIVPNHCSLARSRREEQLRRQDLNSAVGGNSHNSVGGGVFFFNARYCADETTRRNEAVTAVKARDDTVVPTFDWTKLKPNQTRDCLRLWLKHSCRNTRDLINRVTLTRLRESTALVIAVKFPFPRELI